MNDYEYDCSIEGTNEKKNHEYSSSLQEQYKTAQKYFLNGCRSFINFFLLGGTPRQHGWYGEGYFCIFL